MTSHKQHNHEKHNAETKNEQLEPVDPELQEKINHEELLHEMKDKWLRAEAELENVRKRMTREKEEAVKYANANFAKELLIVADNFHRALENAPSSEDETIKSFVEGVKLVEQSMAKVFQQFGIEAVQPLGEKFNPHCHQAMFEVETSENEPGTIVQVLQSGYQLQDRLLRPALVGVAKSVSTKTL